ncbi:MAG: PAS domain-containing protein, partial [Moraxellaceae bacterium]
MDKLIDEHTPAPTGQPLLPVELTNSDSPETMQKVVHQLQVHQIELEMQNEELRRIQLQLEAARLRYFDLYDLAPVGYCTLDERGLILEANLMAAKMFDVSRSDLVNKS